MGTSFESGDFWDHLGGQKSVMSGRWYLIVVVTINQS